MGVYMCVCVCVYVCEGLRNATNQMDSFDWFNAQITNVPFQTMFVPLSACLQLYLHPCTYIHVCTCQVSYVLHCTSSRNTR